MAMAQQVHGYGRAGDAFLALSTSGASRNVVLAALAARGRAMTVVALTGQATDGVEAAAVATPRVLNPLERARGAKIRTAAEAITKGKAAKAATELSAVKAPQANKAIAGLRTAELALAAAQNRLDAATKALDTVKTPEAAERNRRSIYVAVKRNLRYPLFSLFYSPERTETCSRRFVTTTAPQALTLLNDALVIQSAK